MLLLFKNLLFTLIVPGTVAVYLPLRIVRNRHLVAGPAFGVGCLLLLLGASIYAWCVWDFATFGRGTPAPIDAPKTLVGRGLYRYTRNPMYTGVLTVILGWATLFRAYELVLYTLVVGTCFQSFIVFFEEPHLRAEFGSEYEEAQGMRTLAWAFEGALLLALIALIFGRFCMGSYLFLVFTGQTGFANRTLPWVRSEHQ